MIGKKTIATSTAALILAAGFVATGCGIFGDEEEDDGGGDSGGGGSSGAAGSITGGTSTGGVSGTGPTGGGGTTAGGTSGGTTPTGGTGGAQGGASGSGGNGGGAAAMGPYACKGDTANCGVISEFPATTSQAFGNADFSGGFSVFGGLTRDMTNTGAFHVTGMVDNYGKGFNIWFTYCSNLVAYGGIEFKVSGTTGHATAPNTIDFQAQTNADYPWQPFVMDNGVKGACTAATGVDPWGMCVAPGKAALALGDTPVQVMWADITGGMPTAWTAATGPTELVGIQWQFPWASGVTAYPVDVTLDDVKFIGGTGPTTACPMYTMGGGGMGGAGGAGGGAGGAAGAGGGAAGGGAGGAGGGAGGAGGGMAGAAGGGRGGMAGAAGG